MNETIPTPATSTGESSKPSKSIRWSSLLVWTAIIALLALLGWGLLNANATRPGPDVEAPTFEMQFYDGYQWEGVPSANLEDMRGNVVVLNFWASWCVECRKEAPLLESAWRQYRDQGVIFLGIAYLDTEPKSLAYLEEFNITYPNAPDLRTEIADKYKITGVPETFFIDKRGKVAHVVVGPVDASVLQSQINQLLSE